MPDKYYFISSNIEDIKFKPNVAGYDADQVDETLDKIIADYKTFENFYSQAEEYIRKLEEKVKKQKEELGEKEIELAKLKNRLEGLKNTTHLNDSNIDMLRRIDILEKALYKKGIDPTKLK